MSVYVTHFALQVFTAECYLLIELKSTHLHINIFMNLLFIYLFIYLF